MNETQTGEVVVTRWSLEKGQCSLNGTIVNKTTWVNKQLQYNVKQTNKGTVTGFQLNLAKCGERKQKKKKKGKGCSNNDKLLKKNGSVKIFQH